MTKELLELIGLVSGIAVNAVIVAAAILGAYKFRVYRKHQRRYHSSLRCHHHELAGGGTVFIVGYRVKNIGDRPMALSAVRLRAGGIESLKGGDFMLNDRKIICEREYRGLEPGTPGLLEIQVGERSIFQMVCVAEKLEPVIGVVCQIYWPSKRDPAHFKQVYIKDCKRAPF